MNRLGHKPTALAIVLVGFLLVSAILKTVVTQPANTPDKPSENYSVFEDGPTGYSHFLETLKAANLTVTLFRNDFNRLDRLPSRSIMVMVQPNHLVPTANNMVRPPLDYRSIPRLRRWIEAGNTVLILQSFDSGPTLAKNRLRLWFNGEVISVKTTPITPPSKQRITYTTLQHPSTLPQLTTLTPFITQPIVTRAYQRLKPDTFASKDKAIHSVTLLEDPDGNAVLTDIPLGRGHLLLGTNPDLASNQYLFNRQIPQDNFQLLANIVGAYGHTIVFNEFIHGYFAHPTLWEYGLQFPTVRLVVALIVLGLLTVIWHGFSPWQPKYRPAQSLPTVTLQPYVEALGQRYAESHYAALAIDPWMKLLRRRLNQRLGLAPRIPLAKQDTFLTQGLAGILPSADAPTVVAELIYCETLVTQTPEAKLPRKDVIRLTKTLQTLARCLGR